MNLSTGFYKCYCYNPECNQIEWEKQGRLGPNITAYVYITDVIKSRENSYYELYGIYLSKENNSSGYFYDSERRIYSPEIDLKTKISIKEFKRLKTEILALINAEERI